MQLLKEGEQCVGGLVSAGGNAERGSAVESLLFERLIGMDVHLCRLRPFMTEPKRDRGGVDACVEQAHRGCVA